MGNGSAVCHQFRRKPLYRLERAPKPHRTDPVPASRSQDVADSVLKLTNRAVAIVVCPISQSLNIVPNSSIYLAGARYLFYPFLVLLLLQPCARIPFISSSGPPFPSCAGSRFIL